MSSFEAPATPDRVGHPANDPIDRRRGMTGGQTLLFAVAGGVAVGNL